MKKIFLVLLLSSCNLIFASEKPKSMSKLTDVKSEQKKVDKQEALVSESSANGLSNLLLVQPVFDDPAVQAMIWAMQLQRLSEERTTATCQAKEKRDKQ